jgi:hypothetical protein
MPIYCDHSVTSADVRLSVGAEICRNTIKRERNKELRAELKADKGDVRQSAGTDLVTHCHLISRGTDVER